MAAVKRRNWSFIELAHLDKLNPVVRCKWIKKTAEMERGGGCFSPSCPWIPISCFDRHKNHRMEWGTRDFKDHLVAIPQPWHPPDQAPQGSVQPGIEPWGTMLVFCGSSHPLSCRGSPGSVHIYWCGHTRLCWNVRSVFFNVQQRG